MDVLKKLLDSRFISSDRNLVISSSIFLISASNLSRMLLNSESITLKSPNLIGMFLLPLSAISYNLDARNEEFEISWESLALKKGNEVSILFD